MWREPLVMAMSTCVDTARQVCFFTAFSLVPGNFLVRGCLSYLRNNSIFQRFLVASPREIS